MAQLGTAEMPLRVAIIGSGPSGFYAAEALLKSELEVNVDMFEKLPMPFGLVRFGVAPDHAKIKNVTRVYEKTAEDPNFSYWGNVEIGKDVSVEELKKYYDALIFANGAQTDRQLNIPGIDLEGSYTATEFVAWYNGHPEYRDHDFDLSNEVAVVIGQGNVAMDVTRILAKTVEELKETDIASHALDALAKSKVKEIHLIGRRGPAQTAFTPPEIKEFGELEDAEPIVNAADLELNEASQKELEDPANSLKKKNVDWLRQYAAASTGSKGKKIYIHFFESPVELVGDGKVEKVIFEKNELSGEAGAQKARGTGEKVELSAGLFFRSVGYRGVPINGVPFDESWGIFPNKDGRIVEGDSTFPGLYTSGWIKRGPSGVIGTNKADSIKTVEALLADVPQMTPAEERNSDQLAALLSSKGVRRVSYDDWKKIDALELQNGQAKGKTREKMTSIEEILKILDS